MPVFPRHPTSVSHTSTWETIRIISIGRSVILENSSVVAQYVLETPPVMLDKFRNLFGWFSISVDNSSRRALKVSVVLGFSSMSFGISLGDGLSALKSLFVVLIKERKPLG